MQMTKDSLPPTINAAVLLLHVTMYIAANLASLQ